LGNGNGTFAPAAAYPVPHFPTSVAIADLNGDGRPDLVVTGGIANATNNVSVLLGNGDGTFIGGASYTAGSGVFSVVVCDLNGDGRPDIVTANYGATSVSVLLGNGNGTFASPVNYYAGSAPFSLAAADLNGDGKLDLAVADRVDTGTNNRVYVL